MLAGDSAGALLIGQLWLSIDPVHPESLSAAPQSGLGLLRDTFVMAHVNRYKAGVVALGSKTYVSTHKEASGILIEEHTAVMIQRDQITRVVGNGRAGIVDAGSHGTDSVTWLSGTTRYDLRRQEFVP